jgi:endonuclease/exonuclease/phosphatase family metal-dependent hydrolase
VTLGGQAVQVANVHLISYLPRPAKDLKDLLTCLWRTGGIQHREMSRLHEALSREMPVIVAGDFNNTADLGGPAYLKAHGFIDSLASVADDPAKHVTWHRRYGDLDCHFRLDYIFHTAAIKTNSSRVIRTVGSDHYVLVSTLGWAGNSRMPPTKTGKSACRSRDWR